jgi:cellulose biosynthesis protein BcsQ
MRVNILVMNFKGGAAKTTTSSITASYLAGKPLLIEVDKINESDDKINSRDYYNSIQLDWNNDTNKSFQEFEDYLLEDGIKIIDVGAVKLETFHKTMVESGNYDLIDILIIPAMDGSDDFLVGAQLLASVKDFIDPNKILVGFNRFNSAAYTVEEQFDSWFDNADVIEKEFGFKLENNYFTIEDSYAIKKSRKVNETLRYFADQDKVAARKAAQETGITPEDRKKRNAVRIVVQKANDVYSNSIENMLKLIEKKVTSVKKSQKA